MIPERANFLGACFLQLWCYKQNMQFRQVQPLSSAMRVFPCTELRQLTVRVRLSAGFEGGSDWCCWCHWKDSSGTWGLAWSSRGVTGTDWQNIIHVGLNLFKATNVMHYAVKWWSVYESWFLMPINLNVVQYMQFINETFKMTQVRSRHNCESCFHYTVQFRIFSWLSKWWGLIRYFCQMWLI